MEVLWFMVILGLVLSVMNFIILCSKKDPVVKEITDEHVIEVVGDALSCNGDVGVYSYSKEIHLYDLKNNDRLKSKDFEDFKRVLLAYLKVGEFTVLKHNVIKKIKKVN